MFGVLPIGVFRGPSVPTDGPNGWYVPQTADHFSFLGLAVPDFLWLCQEASGSLNNTIGASVPLGVNGSPLHRQTVTGWRRKFIGTTYDIQGNFRTISTTLDLAAGESFAAIILAAHEAPAASDFRFLSLMAAGGNIDIMTRTDGKINSRVATVAVPSANVYASAGATTVHQILHYRNATTNKSGAFTELEEIVNVHNESAYTGGPSRNPIGSFAGANTPTARCCWYAIYKGANAEQDWFSYLAILRGL